MFPNSFFGDRYFTGYYFPGAPNKNIIVGDGKSVVLISRQTFKPITRQTFKPITRQTLGF